MGKFEDLLSKRDDEIEAAEKAKREDERNYNASVGYGILGALGGIIVGFLGGCVLGLISEFLCWLSSGTSIGMNRFDGIIVLSCAIIGGLIGFFTVFNGNRKKP